LGYSCCSNQNIQIEYTDDTGDWGYEDNKWCGIIENNSINTISTTSTSRTTVLSKQQQIL